MAKKPTRVTGTKTRKTYDSAARAGAQKNMARMRRSSSKSERSMGGEGKDSGYAKRVDKRLRAGERTVHVQNRAMADGPMMKRQVGSMPSKTVTKVEHNKPTSGRDIPLPKSNY